MRCLLVAIGLAVIVAGCSDTAVSPSILETVSCVPPDPNGPLAPLDTWDASIESFERSDLDDPPMPGAVVFVGSSSIVFWQTLQDDMAPLPALNRGFGGSVIQQATHYAERIVLPYGPRAIVLYSGDNDVAFGNSADCVLEDVRDFVETIRAQTDAPIYLLSIKPSFARENLWKEMLRANRLMAAFAEVEPGVTFIDVATPMFDDGDALRPELFVADGLHMSPAGYEVWTGVVRPVLLADLSS